MEHTYRISLLCGTGCCCTTWSKKKYLPSASTSALHAAKISLQMYALIAIEFQILAFHWYKYVHVLSVGEVKMAVDIKWPRSRIFGFNIFCSVRLVFMWISPSTLNPLQKAEYQGARDLPASLKGLPNLAG